MSFSWSEKTREDNADLDGPGLMTGGKLKWTQVAKHVGINSQAQRGVAERGLNPFAPH